jgi:hypothetical protein
MDFQLFGTLETAQGPAPAMMCIDDDIPNHCTLQWRHEPSNSGFAIVSTMDWDADLVRLTPKALHRISMAGAIEPLVPLNADETTFMRDTRAVLRRTADGLSGSWTGIAGTTGSDYPLKAEESP